jgi:hypothetical protein
VLDLLHLSSIYDDKTLFVYLDLNATINPKYFTIGLEELINRIDTYDNFNYDVYVGKDVFPNKYINTGAMFLRNTEYTNKLLKYWLNQYYKNDLYKHDNNLRQELEYIYKNNILDSKHKIKVLHFSILSNPVLIYDSFIYHLILPYKSNMRGLKKKMIYQLND